MIFLQTKKNYLLEISTFLLGLFKNSEVLSDHYYVVCNTQKNDLLYVPTKKFVFQLERSRPICLLLRPLL